MSLPFGAEKPKVFSVQREERETAEHGMNTVQYISYKTGLLIPSRIALVLW